MPPLRRTALLATALFLAVWLVPFSSLRAMNEAEAAQLYERGAMLARERANEVMQKAEDTSGEVSALLTKVADNLRALADTKVQIAKKIRSRNWEGLDELKKADEDLMRKALQLHEQLKGMGVAPMEGVGGGRVMRRMAGESREAGGPSSGEGSTGGFRPRERGDRKPGVVVLGSTDELRNWLNEEEARGGGAK